MKKLFYIAILTLVALAGCYSNNCAINNIVQCNYFFYDAEGNAIKYAPAVTVSAILPGGKMMYIYRQMGTEVTSEVPRPDLKEEGYRETVQYARNDTVLINKMSNQRYIQVPMSYFNPCDTLLFRYSNIYSVDTVYIEHESFAHVDLPECGSYRYHKLKSIRATDNAIDHIEIVNPIVNYDQKENIKIYFNEVATSN